MSTAEDFGSPEDFESEEIGVTLKTWYSSRNTKREDFCFCSFIFSFLSHRKHRTVKGGRGNIKGKFPSDAQLKILHLPTPSSEAIGNLIQSNHIIQ